MKHCITLLFLLSLIGCKNKSTGERISEAVSYPRQLARKDVVLDTLLLHVQQKIYTAFVQGITTGKQAALIAIGNRLDSLPEKNKQNLIAYWRAYLHYYSAIFHLRQSTIFYLNQSNEKSAEEEVDKGIAIMEAIHNKNSEDYALLAMLESFSIQFKGIQAPFISGSVWKHGKLAVAIDSANLRAYCALGSHDFHTPKLYGGGRQSEKYLLKAISLPEQTIKNPYLPSWGKEDSYVLLISYYINKEDWEKAKKYFREGIILFPNSNHRINGLGAKLIGK